MRHGAVACVVASLVEAWIEMPVARLIARTVQSLPLWKRGLKFGAAARLAAATESLPLWKRGLKCAWEVQLLYIQPGRFPCGSVD